ncbi:diguanylate cyclase (GGDEF) domain-containing protein [Sphingomonas gellani]|uniref:diguanylate cyclase n=1 Tax=Sphingomonas gellani TaxID=1166340 RepID=A0A1H8F7I4_9SPHN|nr:diguanylate cyclase [Sphingomonas gellani]SEN27833.1 diguanylate cyclase (GGDEF) domain-containing protein [Sphingomonas gellani]
MRLLSSLGARIYGATALSAALALLLGALLLQAGNRSRDAFGWVAHTQTVIISINTLTSDLGEAESGLRGYLMTGDRGYLSRFDGNLREAETVSAALVTLVADNPEQMRHALSLQRFAQAKAQLMNGAIARARVLGPRQAAVPAERDRARRVMARIMREAETMRQAEHRLMVLRTEEANDHSRTLRLLLLLGCPVLVLLIGAVAWQVRTGMSDPLHQLLDAVTRFGEGDRNARALVDRRLGSREFRRLARAYNDTAERLLAAMDQAQAVRAELADANAELRARGETLQARQQSMELLSGVARRLHAVQDETELDEVLSCFLPKVFPDIAGALYVHNHSRNMLVRRASWGDPGAAPETFAPNQCWALRRGQAHAVDRPGSDMICAHAAGDMPVERLCEPIIAGGEVLGLIYVEGLAEDEQQFRLGVLMENVALALVNDNLRSRLREQSIRDPLTKLFNRRYLEEALQLETARAERNGTSLAVVMADVDHFKRFNDGHGHDAGDTLLRAVAAQIQTHFRHGDIVCRYGGEEFTVIAPGASRDLICRRVADLRRTIRDMTVDHAGQRLGPVTMSFGIDVWAPGSVRAPDTLVVSADRALFRAKRLGRDRIELSTDPTQLHAAE